MRNAQEQIDYDDDNEHEDERETTTVPNPEGLKRVAGGRSGPGLNDHRSTVRDSGAPRQGCQSLCFEGRSLGRNSLHASPEVLLWHPSGGCYEIQNAKCEKPGDFADFQKVL